MTACVGSLGYALMVFLSPYLSSQMTEVELRCATGSNSSANSPSNTFSRLLFPAPVSPKLNDKRIDITYNKNHRFYIVHFLLYYHFFYHEGVPFRDHFILNTIFFLHELAFAAVICFALIFTHIIIPPPQCRGCKTSTLMICTTDI